MAGDWYYTPDGRTRMGPLALEEMQRLAQAGALQPTNMVRQGNTSKWEAAAKFPDLFPLSEISTTAIPPPPVPVPEVEAATIRKERPMSERRTIGTKLQASAVRLYHGIGSTARMTVGESRRRLSLQKLRRHLRQLRLEEDQFLVDLGVRLLGAGVSVPGYDGLSDRFRQLSQTQQLTELASQTGGKRAKTGSLKDELRSISADFGLGALKSAGVRIDGRDAAETRFRQGQQEIARTEQEIEACVQQWRTTPPGAKWQMLAGAAVIPALLLVGVLLWANGSTKPAPNADRVVAEVTPSDTEGTTTPTVQRPAPRSVGVLPQPAVPRPTLEVDQPRPRPTLKDMFRRLSPAVPRVEAVGYGNGSGFLIKREGKYLVITNRHVVDHANQGLAIHFPLGDEKKFTVPASKTRLVGIHCTADLAIVDVSAAAADIERLKIEPVILARKGHRPAVGEHVFAIGHPSGGELELTSTLSDGIVSGVDRREEDSRYLQVTVPLNPGNSGGPLFDDEGAVVGVNTFIIRKSSGRDITLEALNFSLESDFVREIIEDPSRSLTLTEIQELINPPPVKLTDELAQKMKEQVQHLLDGGYVFFGDKLEFSTDVFRLQPKVQRARLILFSRGKQYAVAALGMGVHDLDLAVLRLDGTLVAVERNITATPEIKFRADQDGFYLIAVRNSTKSSAVVVLSTLKK